MDSERVSQEATEWLIEMQEAPDDPALRARFAVWLAASPAHRVAWEETARAYDLIGPAAANDARPFRSFLAVPESPGNATVPSRHMAGAADRLHQRRRRLTRRTVAGFAATVIAVCLVFLFLPNLSLRWYADYATAAGEQRIVNLADGSTVELGPDSAMDVAYAGNERRVRLLAGRAYFEVTHDATRPFEVEAHGLQVTDLGTGFDVRLAPDGAAVAVAHGAVQVDYADAAPPLSRRLHTGEWMRIGWSGQAAQGIEPPSQVAAWRHGRIIANDRPVAEVVNEIRPYFSGWIVLANAGLGRHRVTGVYDLHHPVAALHALAQARPGMSIRRISPWVIVVSGG